VLPYFRISRRRANEMLTLIEGALSRWREIGLALGMTKQDLDQFADAFEHSEREAARQAARHGARHIRLRVPGVKQHNRNVQKIS